jgi:hypothetical protein
MTLAEALRELLKYPFDTRGKWFPVWANARAALAEHEAQQQEPIDALDLAIMFHHTYERLAPSVGYDTRVETRVFDPESPNGKLMLAVCAELLPKLYTHPAQDEGTKE